MDKLEEYFLNALANIDPASNLDPPKKDCNGYISILEDEIKKRGMKAVVVKGMVWVEEPMGEHRMVVPLVFTRDMFDVFHELDDDDEEEVLVLVVRFSPETSYELSLFEQMPRNPDVWEIWEELGIDEIFQDTADDLGFDITRLKTWYIDCFDESCLLSYEYATKVE